MTLSTSAPVLTYLLLAAVSLLAGCEDKVYPGYNPVFRDACEGLTCTEGTCSESVTPVPLCFSPGPDGGVEDRPEPPPRIALPATFIPLPTTGAPVEGTIEVSELGGGRPALYFEFEATGQHLYRFTATCEDSIGCGVYVADAQGVAFHVTSTLLRDDMEHLDTVFRPLRAGRHVIAFSHADARNVSRYSLQLQAIPDDHGDLAESATPLPEGDVTFEGTLQAFTDTDVFTFSAQEGERFQVRCTELGSHLPKVFSAAGELPAEGPAEDGVVRSPESGPLFIHVDQGTGTETPLQYRCSVRNVTHDDHGDTLAEATPLGASATVEGWFEARGEVDVFQVELALDAYYLVSCSTPSGTSCSFRVANAAGGVLLERLHVTAASPAAAFAALSAGVHQIQVRGSGVHGYQLQFRLGGTDEYGDSAEQATLVPTGSLRAELQGPDDLDFLAVDTLAGHGYIFTCTSDLSSSLSIVLRGADGEVVPPSSSFSVPRVEVRPLAAERYTVQVQGVARGPVPHPYSCTFEDRGLDAHGDTPEEATAVSLPATLGGRLEVSADVDVYAFTGTARQFISTRLEFAPGSFASGTLRLKDAAGNELVRTITQQTFSHRFQASGTYFIEVRGAASDYTLGIQDLGLDDHGETLATATALPLGVTASGRLQGDWDQDVFSLPATVGRFYRLTCVPEVPNPLGECSIALLGAGSKLGLDVTSPRRHEFLFDVSVSGTVGLAIQGIGAFTLRVEEAMLDDHGGQPARATPLTLGSVMAGTLEAGIDEDFFVMPLEPGGRYRLQLTAGFRLNFQAQDPGTGSFIFIASDGTFVAGDSQQVLIRVAPFFGEGTPPLGPYQVRVDRSSL